jgi:O-antigen ligase
MLIPEVPGHWRGATGNPRVILGWYLMVAGILLAFSSTCISIAITHAGMLIAFVGWALARPALQALPGFWWAAAFAIWQVISALVAQAHGGESALRHGLGMQFVWFSFYLGFMVFSEPRIRRIALNMLAMAIAASCVLAILQFSIGYGGDRPFRVSSIGVRMKQTSGFMPLHLTQGFIMAQYALILCVSQGAGSTGVWTLWLLRLTTFLALILSTSRSAFLGFAVGCTALIASGGRRYLLPSLGTLILLLVGLTAWQRMWLPEAVENLSHDGRLIHWRIASQMTMEHPWFGVGGANDYKRNSDIILHQLYPDGSKNQWEQAPHAHNSFLAISSEHGFPCLVFYLLFMGAIFGALYRQRATHRQRWRLGCGLLASFLIAGQFEPMCEHSSTSYVLYLTLAWAMALPRDDHAREPGDQVPEPSMA